MILDIFYGLGLLGSFSLGYSLLRIIMPDKQEASILEKLEYSFAIGILVFLPGLFLSISVFEQLFFVVTGIIYCILFALFFVIRQKDGLIDDVELIQEEKKTIIPNKVLTEEEKNKPINKNKKESLITPIPPTFNIPIINNDQSEQKIMNKNLLIKEKKINQEDSKQIIEDLRKKTLEIKDSEKSSEKKEALNKLKEFANQIDKKTKPKETINKKKEDSFIEDIDEDELNAIGDEFYE